jgi:hypothetical protein
MNTPFQSFVSLLENYFAHGWLFFLLHVLVAGLILVHSWWMTIRPEIRALRRWQPKPEGEPVPPGGSQIAGTLDSFVEDCRNLASQGLPVHMTDFSDRLDSLVDGMIGQLHDRCNLFLLVGIAGTLFGMFDFARQVAASSGAAEALLPALVQGMSTAFPIGFVGLVLTIFAQIAAAAPEHWLRKALAGATSRALQVRSAVSRSQARILEEAAGRVEAAMAPLQELRATLTESVRPVVEELGQRLEASLEVVRDQSAALSGAVDGLHSAVSGVHQGVQELGVVASQLHGLVDGVPRALEALGELAARQDEFLTRSVSAYEAVLESARQGVALVEQVNRELLASTARAEERAQAVAEASGVRLTEVGRSMSAAWEQAAAAMSASWESSASAIQRSLASAQEGFAASARALETTDREIRTLPVELVRRTDVVLQQLDQEAVLQWKEMAREVHRRVETDFINYVTSLRRASDDVQAALTRAAGEWERLAANSQTLLQRPMLEAIDELKTRASDGLRDIHAIVLDDYPKLVRLLEELNRGLERDLQQAGNLARAMAGVSNEMGGTMIARSLGDLSAAARSLNDAVARLEQRMFPPKKPRLGWLRRLVR